MAEVRKYDLLTVLRSLFETELDFPVQPPRVFIYNQAFRLPEDEGLFGLVQFVGSVPFGSSLRMRNNPATGDLEEIQSVNVKEMYQFDLWSADDSAELRKEDPVFALNSYTSQSLSEQYSFKLANLPTAMVDVSAIEASRRLNRYSMTFNALREVQRIRPIPYFNVFDPTELIIQQ